MTTERSAEEIAKWLLYSPLLSLTGQGLEESKEVRWEVQKLIARTAIEIIQVLGGDIMAYKSEVYARCGATDVYVSSTFPIGPKMEKWDRSYGVEAMGQNSAADIAMKVRTELGTRVQRLMTQSKRYNIQY